LLVSRKTRRLKLRQPGTPADGPFFPAPALPGGIVLALYPPDSPLLKRERVHEAERYNTSGKSDSKLLKHS
jgi:endo-1,4-beta-xylanase